MTELKRRVKYQNGTLSLEERRKRPWVWVFRWVTVDGKRPKVIIGTVEEYPTKAEAMRAAEHWRMAANAEAAIQPRCTMTGLIDRYIEEILRPCFVVAVGGEQDESAQMSHQCAKTYRGQLDNWVRPRWETYLVTDFENPATRAAAEQWLRGLLKSSKNPGGLAGKSVCAIHNAMRLVFKFAVKWGYIRDNPLADKKVELPRGSAKRRRRPSQLTPAMFFYLLLRLGPVAKLAVSCVGWLGPRRSEPFGLRWADLDLERAEVTFRQGVVQGRITPLKTEASRATLSIPEDVLLLLKEWRSITPYSQPGDWVFASPYTKGKRPYWPDTLLKKHIQPIAQEAGLPKIGWHSFRHSLSAWAKQSGLSLEAAKTLLRHQDITTTAQIYGEWELGEIRAAQHRVVEYVKKRAAAEGWIGGVGLDATHGADSEALVQ